LIILRNFENSLEKPPRLTAKKVSIVFIETFFNFRKQ